MGCVVGEVIILKTIRSEKLRKEQEERERDIGRGMQRNYEDREWDKICRQQDDELDRSAYATATYRPFEDFWREEESDLQDDQDEHDRMIEEGRNSR